MICITSINYLSTKLYTKCTASLRTGEQQTLITIMSMVIASFADIYTM